MSVLIGVMSALLIVALVAILVLRLQCTRGDNRRKRNKGAAVAAANSEQRGSISGPTLSDKGGNNLLQPALSWADDRKGLTHCFTLRVAERSL